MTGQVVEQGNIVNVSDFWTFDLNGEKPGIYFIHLRDEMGVDYRVKVVKK